MSVVEIWKTSPPHWQKLLCTSHSGHSHACNSSIPFCYIQHILREHRSQTAGGMQDIHAVRDEGKKSMQTEEKSWRTTIFKPADWNLCPKQACKQESQSAFSASSLGVKPIGLVVLNVFSWNFSELAWPLPRGKKKRNQTQKPNKKKKTKPTTFGTFFPNGK